MHDEPHGKSEPRRAMTDDEYRRLLRVSPACLRRFLAMLSLTGARPEEMRRLRWEDADLDKGMIVIREHKNARYTRSPHVIALTGPAVKLLAWLHRHRPAGIEEVFLCIQGKAWEHTGLRIALGRAKRRAGLPADCFVYGLRQAWLIRAMLRAKA